MSDLLVLPAGDSAVVLRLGAAIDPALNMRALAIARELAQGDDAIRDIVVGYASVTVYFDPLRLAPVEIEGRLRRAARSHRTRA